MRHDTLYCAAVGRAPECEAIDGIAAHGARLGEKAEAEAGLWRGGGEGGALLTCHGHCHCVHAACCDHQGTVHGTWHMPPPHVCRRMHAAACARAGD